uniref:Uncharacterized protein n=1 Tax=Hyaloperonospora arabidopsidis (strain Emoy2) TaxID=559515 RepID=M4C4G0_HYAAE
MGKRKRDHTIQIDCSKAFLFSAGTEAASCAQNMHESIKKSLRVAKALCREMNKEKCYLPKEVDRLANPLREIDILVTEAERTLCRDLPYALRDLEKKRKMSTRNLESTV